MFSWHETTWRNLCRAAFGLLVVLPTCAVAAAAIWCRSPLSLEYHRRELARHLALDVQIAQVSFPRPGVTLYQDVAINDPETAQPLFRCAALEWQTSGQATSITCWRAELLETSRLDLVAETVNRQLRRLAGSQHAIQLEAPQLTLRLADGLAPQTLDDVHGQLQTTADEPQAALEFHLAGDQAAQPARISLRRTAADPTATAIMIETGASPLPSRLIALCCPGWEGWSTASSFCGRLSWHVYARAWTGEVEGRITGIDLDALVTRYTGHRLSGEAEVHLEHARMEAGRLADAAGKIHAGPGLVACSLLSAAAKQLNATGNNPTEAPGYLAPYDKLAIGFAIDCEGLVIHGLCDGSPGTLLVGHNGTGLLAEPPTGPQPLVGLVRLLASSDETVPGDLAAQMLLRVLPADAVKPHVQTSAAPAGHLLPRNPFRR